MRKTVLLLVALVMSSCAYQMHYETESVNIAGESNILQSQEKPQLRVGERLVYPVSWTGIPSGHFILEVKEKIMRNGVETIHVTAQARPNSFFRLFYDVEYEVDSYIDPLNLRPVYFQKVRRLKNKITIEKIEFDYQLNKVTWEYSNPETKIILEMPKNPQDLLSSLYYFRLNPGEIARKEIFMNIVYNGIVWPVNFSAKKIVRIKVSNQLKFRAVEVSPVAGLAKHITGFSALRTFFSLDSCRTPLIFKIPTKIGGLAGVLANPEKCINSN